jgi:hypothetical protein
LLAVELEREPAFAGKLKYLRHHHADQKASRGQSSTTFSGFFDQWGKQQLSLGLDSDPSTTAKMGTDLWTRLRDHAMPRSRSSGKAIRDQNPRIDALWSVIKVFPCG